MAEVVYSTGIELPYAIERGRTNLIRCPVYRSGALVAPGSGVATVYDRAGSVASTGAVTVVGSVAQYTVPSLAAYAYDDGWRVEWALSMPDGVTHTFPASAALVRTAPRPEVTDVSLFRRVSSLDPNGAAPITSLETYQDYIDESWVEIQRRLFQAGRRPWLIVDATALREPHLLLTLALIFEDLATRLNPAYSEQADRYRAHFSDAWARVSFEYDTDGDGIADGPKKSGRSAGFWFAGRS